MIINYFFFLNSFHTFEMRCVVHPCATVFLYWVWEMMTNYKIFQRQLLMLSLLFARQSDPLFFNDIVLISKLLNARLGFTLLNLLVLILFLFYSLFGFPTSIISIIWIQSYHPLIVFPISLVFIFFIFKFGKWREIEMFNRGRYCAELYCTSVWSLRVFFCCCHHYV